MRKLIDKNNLFAAISYFIAGIVIILGSAFLISAGQIRQLTITIGGFFIMIMGIFILFGENRVIKFMMPTIYIALGIVYLVAFIVDIDKKLFGMGFVSEIVAMLMFYLFGAMAILKLVLNKRSVYIGIAEVLSAFVMGACVFFVLFSTSSFGYKFSKMNTTEALQIFYLLLVFGGYTVIAISNSIFPQEPEPKKRR